MCISTEARKLERHTPAALDDLDIQEESTSNSDQHLTCGCSRLALALDSHRHQRRERYARNCVLVAFKKTIRIKVIEPFRFSSRASRRFRCAHVEGLLSYACLICATQGGIVDSRTAFSRLMVCRIDDIPSAATATAKSSAAAAAAAVLEAVAFKTI